MFASRADVLACMLMHMLVGPCGRYDRSCLPGRFWPKWLKCIFCTFDDVSDHSTNNTLDPIRTLQLSMLGENSTKLGDHLGSPCVTPLFLFFYYYFLILPFYLFLPSCFQAVQPPRLVYSCTCLGQPRWLF